MRKGQHESKHKPNGKRAGKHALLLLSLIVVLCVATVGTVAYFTDTAQSTNAGLTIGNVACTVQENTDGSFTVTNTGNVPAYIRVAVAANYVATDNSGTMHYTAPTIASVVSGNTSLSSPNNDGIYYYPTAVAANGGSFSVTLTLTTSGTAPEGYEADVELVAEAIQGGVPAVAKDAWGVSIYG